MEIIGACGSGPSDSKYFSNDTHIYFNLFCDNILWFTMEILQSYAVYNSTSMIMNKQNLCEFLHACLI